MITLDEVDRILASASSNREDEPDAEDTSNTRPPSSASQLVALALEHFSLGRTTEGEPFAVRKNGPLIALMLRGQGTSLRKELARLWWNQKRTAAPAHALTDALATIEGLALEAGTSAVHLRVAQQDNSIILDMGDDTGRSIEVGAGGWRILESSPMFFRRTLLTAPLPIPTCGDDIRALRPFVNVTDESWPLLLSWMIAALFADIPHPILLLSGQQGAGKSTLARTIVSLIDASISTPRTAPRDVEQWCVAASAGWCVAIDNISTISDWWSDALCRAVTGDALIRRALYTDGELAVVKFRRPMILTGIDVGALRGDLADRLLRIELEPISAGARRYESSMEQAFAAKRPQIFAALLDLLSNVLEDLPTIQLDELPRMADFARIAAAVDRVIGTTGLDTYLGQRHELAQDVVDSDPLAMPIVSVAKSTGGWTGTSTELFSEIAPDKPPAGWPRSARALAARLRRLIPALKSIGVIVETVRIPGSRSRGWSLSWVDPRATEPSSCAQCAPMSPAQAAGVEGTCSAGANRAYLGAFEATKPPNSTIPTVNPSDAGRDRQIGRIDPSTVRAEGLR